MLKFSTYTSVWILSILLLVAPVTKTKNYITNNTDSSTYHYYHNQYYHRHCESLINFNYILFNFTHVLQDFIYTILNGTYVYDSILLTNPFETNNSKDTINSLKKLQKLSKSKLKDFPIYTEGIVIPSSLKNTNTYVNDAITFNNVLSRSIKERNKDQKNQVRYTWKRRTLCTVPDNEKYSIEKLFEGNTLSSSREKETDAKKTLLDYDGSIFMHNVDPDSLRTHVRVKRDKSDSEVAAPLKFQQDYVKDLANSFPQNNYDSIDENSYDDDVSFDTKREIKSQEFFINDEQSKAFPDENDQHKILNVYPFTVPVYVSDDTSAKSDFISAPSDGSKVNTFANKNERFVDQVGNQGMSEEPKSNIINRLSRENSEVQNLPEDPMLSVELVRKKRNDYAKVHNKRNLEKKASSSIQNLIDSKGKTYDKEKRSILESHKSESHLNPSSLVAANLKAHLLRYRRKAKNNKQVKSNKLKKEKKHVGKKHNGSNNSQQSVKDARLKNTDRSKVSRKRKVHEAKTEGKPKVGIASVVSKENNDNNFRRRSIKLKKSIKGTDSDIDVFSRNDEPTFHEKLDKVSGDKIDEGNSKFSLIAAEKGTELGSDVNEVKAGSDKDTSVFVTQNEEQGAFVKDEQSMPSLNEIKLRTKRDKNTQSHHGFLNEEEELRYYENIREPGSEIDLYDNQDESQSLVGNVAEGNRAVRSIEEVKQLAQKLVTKVNELQNYLDIEKSTGNKKREKHIETRAIDDLCANVSGGCDTFKEAPKIVQKCVPTVNNKFGSKAKIVERNVDSSGVTEERKFGKIANKNSAEKKRSVVRRGAKALSNTSKGVRRQSDTKSRRKWGKWTDWSSCSVTCGKGRQIRWRYCLRECTTAETEMEEKACQLPACPPGKFLGIF
ncbi:hypothetical protein ANTQUA_LOCUS1177 [Anthophora quadrimaculata]